MNLSDRPPHLATPAFDFASVELELLRRGRDAEDRATLQFIAVNDSHLLAPYRQSALWQSRGGVLALSGVTQVESNGPYVQWLQAVCQVMSGQPAGPLAIAALPPILSAAWDDWLPAEALWLPFGATAAGKGGDGGGLLLARDVPWTADETAALADWIENWHRLALAQAQQVARARSVTSRLGRTPLVAGALAAVTAVLFAVPVGLSVLAPGELVPANPVAVRAPLDGVVQKLLVKPNESVRKGQPLFAYDDAAMASRRTVAAQALATAETELRQIDQQSLYDNKARAALPGARGNAAEKRAELALIKEQLGRSQVLATSDGTALFDDQAEWTGKPVTTGERVMRLAAPDDKEIEAWVAIGDAIPLPPGARVRFYLSASPTESIAGQVRYMSHEAQRRPDGNSAYRVRATIDGSTAQRIGLRGTVRLEGEQVSLAYWMFRRPLAVVREFFGL